MKKQTLNGADISEAQIHDWADEAEAGFPVEHLRKRGRPLLGEVPTTVDQRPSAPPSAFGSALPRSSPPEQER